MEFLFIFGTVTQTQTMRDKNTYLPPQLHNPNLRITPARQAARSLCTSYFLLSRPALLWFNSGDLKRSFFFSPPPCKNLSRVTHFCLCTVDTNTPPGPAVLLVASYPCSSHSCKAGRDFVLRRHHWGRLKTVLRAAGRRRRRPEPMLEALRSLGTVSGQAHLWQLTAWSIKNPNAITEVLVSIRRPSVIKSSCVQAPVGFVLSNNRQQTSCVIFCGPLPEGVG